ncbi:hypothetical protein [uncultured Microbacterium sp.]|uniref:hypothetical protein n=1 Tax=uncultured Microbacterium sp. TaxID=191216 RepID=UPI0025D4B598|nr:hypothetical protein [uncultured Microbacterium sp.]
MTSEPADRTPSTTRLPWGWLLVVAGLAGVAIGRSIPPPVPDGQWWATYLTSPGFGGTAAFLGAAIAGGIAWRNSAKDRRQRQLTDQRSQWWDRFTWATEKAIAPDTSVVGMRVLNALVVPSLATAEDARMAIEISKIVDPSAPAQSEGGG